MTNEAPLRKENCGNDKCIKKNCPECFQIAAENRWADWALRDAEPKTNVLMKGSTAYCNVCKESIEIKTPMQTERLAALLEAYSHIHRNCRLK